MKNFTKKEIEKKVWDIWHEFEDNHWGELPSTVDVSVYKDRVDITLAAMYSAPSLSYYHLKALADYFETENINDDDRFSETGCETCDYGSSYGFTLTIRPSKNNKEI